MNFKQLDRWSIIVPLFWLSIAIGPLVATYYTHPNPERHWFYETTVTKTVMETPWWFDAFELYFIIFFVLFVIYMAAYGPRVI